ncbi:class I SAM-dependent methyltransferase [Kribbella sp. NPDC050124]|uniref:class I SAM-dependent methyltransferase n=1 Tax=Kribbella sp. NPDC050124 TaxID=3364114 RepID=UPI0037B8B1DC
MVSADEGRQPTSHERMAGRPWDASYQDGPPAWDFGGPQPAVVRAAARFTGTVLDAGCGSGENALHVASLGLPVLGVDVAETALALAREKAAARGLKAEFTYADALQLERLGRRFQTVLDCGLFHTFDADERRAYVASLAAVIESGGSLYILCFRDAGPGSGPHPLIRADLESPFTTGWTIVEVSPTEIRANLPNSTEAPAWLATIRRTG